jgi:hypothetical protein
MSFSLLELVYSFFRNLRISLFDPVEDTVHIAFVGQVEARCAPKFQPVRAKYLGTHKKKLGECVSIETWEGC